MSEHVTSRSINARDVALLECGHYAAWARGRDVIRCCVCDPTGEPLRDVIRVYVGGQKP